MKKSCAGGWYCFQSFLVDGDATKNRPENTGEVDDNEDDGGDGEEEEEGKLRVVA